MTSWQFLRLLNVLRHSPLEDHPVYRRETGFPPAWQLALKPVARVGGILMWLIIGLVVIGGWFRVAGSQPALVILVLVPTVVVLTPSGLPWMVVLSVTVATVVVREREERTWDTLRAIPLDLDQIVLCKMRGSLSWIRAIVRRLLQIMVITSTVVGSILMVAVMDSGLVKYRYSLDSTAQGAVLVGLVMGFIGLGMIIQLADRTQQVVLMALAALLSGTLARSSRSAIGVAVVGTLLVWLAEVTVTTLFLLVCPHSVDGFLEYSLAAMVIFGPLAAFLLRFPVFWALGYLAAVFLLRELGLRWLWWRAQRAPREM